MQKKQFHCVYIFLMFLSSVLRSADHVQQAQDAFASQDWSQALHLYRQVADKDSMIWQNIGTCYAQLGQYAQALVCLKRAYVGISRAQVTTVLQSEIQAMEQLSLPVPSTLQQVWHKFLLMVPMILLKLLFLLVLLYAALLILGIFGSHHLSKVRIFMTILLCLIFGTMWHNYNSMVADNLAVVMQKNVALYAGPERNFHIMPVSLAQGSVVKVVQHVQGMYQVEQHHVRGWVGQGSIELIYTYE